MPPEQQSSMRPSNITQQKGSTSVPGLRTPDHDAVRLGMADTTVSSSAYATHVPISDDGAVTTLSPQSTDELSGDPPATNSPAGQTVVDTFSQIPIRPIRPLGTRAEATRESPLEIGGHLDDFVIEEGQTVVPQTSQPVRQVVPVHGDADDVGEFDVPEPSVEEMVASAERDIQKVIEERKRLEQHTAQLVQERKMVEDELEPIKHEQEDIDIRLSNVEKSEHAAQSPEQRRANEADRWGIVEERYQVELRLIKCRERLEAVAEAIHQDELKYSEMEKEEALLRKRIETLETEGKRRELQKSLDDAMRARKSVEDQSARLGTERGRIQELLLNLGQKEASLEAQTGKVGELEVGARSAAELRELAEKRYQLEKERHGTEEARWRAEDEIALIEAQYQQIVARLTDAEAKQVEIERKIKELG